jgi:hypothetical protein
MSKTRIAALIAAVLAVALFLASPLPSIIGFVAYVGVFQTLFPSTISWDAKNADRKCYGAIDDPPQWPPAPHAACAAMYLCANEAVLTDAQRQKLYAQIRRTPGCQEP